MLGLGTTCCCCSGRRRGFIPILAALATASVMIASSLIAVAQTAREEGIRAEVGKPAPDFTLSDLDGKEHKLSDLKGKIVILEWFNPDCPYVKASHQRGPLKEQGNRIDKEDDKVWLAINSGAPGKQGAGVERNKRAVEEYEMKYPILIDESGDVGRLYGAKTTPHMFIIDKEGVLRYAGAIDDDPFGQKAESGKAFVNYVDKALKEIEEGTEVTETVTRPYGCPVKYDSGDRGGRRRGRGGNN